MKTLISLITIVIAISQNGRSAARSSDDGRYSVISEAMPDAAGTASAGGYVNSFSLCQAQPVGISEGPSYKIMAGFWYAAELSDTDGDGIPDISDPDDDNDGIPDDADPDPYSPWATVTPTPTQSTPATPTTTPTATGEPLEFTFTLFHTSEGNENWVSVPLETGEITDTFSLGQSIAGRFTPDDGDSIMIQTWDGESQTSRTTAGDYIDIGTGLQWWWDTNQAIETGMMLKVYIYHPSGLPEFSLTWSISGDIPDEGDVVFTLRHTSYGNENWISVPFNSDITDAFSLGESIASCFTPDNGDSIIIETWDGASQTSQTTTGDYIDIGSGPQWWWDNDQDLEVGQPVVVYIYHPAGLPNFELDWPGD